MGNAEVVDGRIVEFPFPAHHAHVRKFLLDRVIIFPSFRLGAVIFHHHKLQIPVSALGEHGPDAVIKVAGMVLIGNNNGNQRLPLEYEFCMVDPEIHALLHFFGRDPHSFIMIHDCPGTGLKSIKLAFRIAGRGILVTAPVIQHLGNMDDLPGLFRTAEDEIIILRAVKFRPEALYLLQERAFYHEQMADIVYAGQ